MNALHVGFVGFGHMAQVICRALERSRLIPRSQMAFIRRDPQKMKANEQEFGITATTFPTLVQQSDLLLLCVRPAQAEPIMEELARLGAHGKRILSVLAGKRLSFFQKYLGDQFQVLRVMPNIASAVGEGMSLIAAPSHVSDEFRSVARLLFSSMGEVLDIEEHLMDIGTGLSGSGPGFVFHLIEAMARAGVQQGLSYDKALKMAAQTFAGAARLVLKGGLPEELIHQIATPNGTTEAGLKVMVAQQVGNRFQDAIVAAARRSKELSGHFQ